MRGLITHKESQVVTMAFNKLPDHYFFSNDLKPCLAEISYYSNSFGEYDEVSLVRVVFATSKDEAFKKVKNWYDTKHNRWNEVYNRSMLGPCDIEISEPIR